MSYAIDAIARGKREGFVVEPMHFGGQINVWIPEPKVIDCLRAGYCTQRATCTEI